MMAFHTLHYATLFMLSKSDDGLPGLMLFDRVCWLRAMMPYNARSSPNVYFYPRAMIACHARRHPTMCAVQRRRWHVTPYIVRLRVLPNHNVGIATLHVIRPCVLSKVHVGMPRPRLFDQLCCPRAMLTFHARRRRIVYAFQQQRWHATPDVARSCIRSKGDYCIATTYVVRMCVFHKGDDGMPHPS